MTECKGRNGTVVFDGSFVTIKREGLFARTSVGKGEKRIPLASVAAVQWKPAGPMVNGFIQFTVPGGTERRSKAGSQTSDAGHDENSVIFTRAQMAAFDALRAEIEQAIARGSEPRPQPGPVGGASELKRLAELHAAGVLTDAEFATAKARALGL